MRDFLYKLLHKEEIKKEETKPLTIVNPGERWILNIHSNDPFEEKPSSPVKILDVRNGWVRYDMGGIFRDERMEINSFVRMYKLIVEDKKS